MSNNLCPLSLDIYTVNGEVIRFVQDDPAYVREILDDVNKQRLFTERSIMIASVASVSSIATREIEMIKFHFKEPIEFHPMLGMKDVREVTREQFEERFLSLHIHDRIKRREVADGEMIEAYGEAHLRSGNVLILEFQIQKRSPRDHMIAFRDAFHLPLLPFHVSDGGYGVLNTQNITRLTAHPGPSMVPPGSWHAEPGATKSALDPTKS